MSVESKLEALVSKTVAIPAVPQVLTRMQSVVADPTSSILDAVKVVEEDPGLGARCLRVANSAIYGLRVPATSLRQAAGVLGMRKLQELAIQCSLVAQYAHLRQERAFNIDMFWRHGAVTAVAARHVARVTTLFRGSMAETAASCGLLHNIGRLAMVEAFRAGYLDVILPVGGRGDAACQAECEAFGFTHAEVGAVLAERWKLAPEIVEVARDHHRPRTGKPTLATLVSYASHIAHELLNCGDLAVKESLTSEGSTFLGISQVNAEEATKAIVENAVEALVVA